MVSTSWKPTSPIFPSLYLGEAVKAHNQAFVGGLGAEMGYFHHLAVGDNLVAAIKIAFFIVVEFAHNVSIFRETLRDFAEKWLQQSQNISRKEGITQVFVRANLGK